MAKTKIIKINSGEKSAVNSKSGSSAEKKLKSYHKVCAELSRKAESIILIRNLLENLLVRFNTELDAGICKSADLHIELARALGDVIDKYKFTKDRRLDIRNSILNLCKMSSMLKEQSVEEKLFAEKWMFQLESNDKDAEELEQLKRMFLKKSKLELGLDFDENEVDFSEGGLISLLDLSTQKYSEIAQKDLENRIVNFGLSPEQDKVFRKFVEDQSDTQLYNIDIILLVIMFKIFGSQGSISAFGDPGKALNKALAAFTQDDISGILKIETEYIDNLIKERPNELNDLLNFFIPLLEEQAEELELIYSSMVDTERFSKLKIIIDDEFKDIENAISITQGNVAAILSDFPRLINEVLKPKNKKGILEIVDKMNELMDSVEDDDDIFWDDDDDDDDDIFLDYDDDDDDEDEEDDDDDDDDDEEDE